jgi:hypothetical protein
LARHFKNLDQVEVRLIAELEMNPKQTHAELASKLGPSQPTVRAKLQGLFDCQGELDDVLLEAARASDDPEFRKLARGSGRHEQGPA